MKWFRNSQSYRWFWGWNSPLRTSSFTEVEKELMTYHNWWKVVVQPKQIRVCNWKCKGSLLSWLISIIALYLYRNVFPFPNVSMVQSKETFRHKIISWVSRPKCNFNAVFGSRQIEGTGTDWNSWSKLKGISCLYPTLFYVQLARPYLEIKIMLFTPTTTF